MRMNLPAIGLATYTISVREYYQMSQLMDLNNLGNKRDILPSMLQYLESLKNAAEDNPLDKKLYKILKLDESKSRIIRGVLESGDYGQIRQIYDRKTKKNAKIRLQKMMLIYDRFIFCFIFQKVARMEW